MPMSIPHTHCYPARPALAAALILCLCCSQENASAATINITTNTQGITNNLCSLQEAIYASTFQTNQAIIDQSGRFLRYGVYAGHRG
jgi:hypothetical protein